MQMLVREKSKHSLPRRLIVLPIKGGQFLVLIQKIGVYSGRESSVWEQLLGWTIISQIKTIFKSTSKGTTQKGEDAVDNEIRVDFDEIHTHTSTIGSVKIKEKSVCVQNLINCEKISRWK